MSLRNLFHQEAIVELCRLEEQTSSNNVNMKCAVVLVVICENADDD